MEHFYIKPSYKNYNKYNKINQPYFFPKEFVFKSLCPKMLRHKYMYTCKTFATDLLDADIPNTELEVTQLGGWKSIQTLNEYAAPNIKKQKSVSDILSKAFLPKKCSFLLASVNTILTTQGLLGGASKILMSADFLYLLACDLSKS
jgi:hypothetical protein